MTVDAQLPSLNDFYAGVLALLAIVLFAKFVTHRRHAGLNPCWIWALLHVMCVVLAGFGVLACLRMLGWGHLPFGIGEPRARSIVLWLAGLSTVILALDVAVIACGGPPPKPPSPGE
jgi:hypothetical protein